MKDFTGNLHGNSRFFTGREYDGEMGLYYLRARYYSADTGRFISRDPIGQVDDVNLYGYVGNSPVNRVDPSGLYAKQAIPEVADFIGIKDASEGLGSVAAFWTGYATDDKNLMAEGEAGMRDSLGRLTDPTAFVMNRLNKIGKVGDGAMSLFGGATKGNYAKNFWKSVGEKIEGYQVHHALPQKYEKMFEEIGTNIHENKYLRGVSRAAHKDITNAWDKFDPKGDINVSVKEIQNFAKEIDSLYRDKFIFTK